MEQIKMYWNIAICWMAPGWKSNLHFTSTFSFLTLPLIRTSWPYPASPDCCIWSHKDSWSKSGSSNHGTVWVLTLPTSLWSSQGWHWEWSERFLFQQYLLEEYRLDLSFSSFPTPMYSRKHREWTWSKHPGQSIAKCPPPAAFLQLISTFYSSFVNILLPYDAKTIGTRFRWWQPKHDGLDQNDWAIDNVLISGSADQRTVMLDTFSSAPLPQHERSPADAGPTGRIAFDMVMEDKTTGKRSTWLWVKEQEASAAICDFAEPLNLCLTVMAITDNPIAIDVLSSAFCSQKVNWKDVMQIFYCMSLFRRLIYFKERKRNLEVPGYCKQISYPECLFPIS